ncbi:MAG TPA: M1 family metallopeptidase [Magnetospirillaceae bacterium]|nr:M1 family metallopeptidase [Magnetospirillaceae bacterium]
MTKSVRRLAEQFAPAHYNLSINITKRTDRIFSGDVTITGKLARTAQHIALHAKELTITSAHINDVEATATKGDDDELKLATGADIVAGEHTIYLHFEGAITDPMHGLYPCYFTQDDVQKELLMTQLESHSAREVFPCVDEPAAKATFRLTVYSEPDITVLSNTPVASSSQKHNALVTTFEPTPKMSTYLLAFVAGDLAYKETMNKHGVNIRVYATPAHANELGFALDHAAKVLDYYDEYFGTPYPLPKCDLVACPDFAAGAMENWGLITFREAALLVDETDTPADTRQHVAQVIGHELAHQWFGNLVTMEWWDHLWLNESFANWMEHYSTAHFYPNWKIWEQYSATDQQYAFSRDGLASVQAVQQHVNHPDEIATLFDPAIVYAKGGSLIRMLHEYLGADIFREGLRIYMDRHAYANTTTADLWRALGEASGKDVEHFMTDWVSKPGHPVIDYAIKDGHATIKQQRFFANPVQADKNDTTVWPVPLLASTLPDAELFTDATSEFVVAPAPFYLLNQGGTGFYHTHYDTTNLAAIAAAVDAGTLDTFDRQRLLMDSIALNRAGLAPTLDTLDLLSHYSKESDYAVWQAVSSVLGTLRLLINDDPAYKPDLQRFTAKLSRAQFERLGWAKHKGESHFDTLLRPSVLANMVYAEDSAVMAKCLSMFDAMTKPEDIPSDIRSIVYSAAVRELGKPAVDTLLNWYKTTPSADERINICAGISSLRDDTVVREVLVLFTTKAIKLQDVFYWFIYFIRNRYARQATWEWLQQNWAWVEKNFGGDHDYGLFPKYSASAFSTAKELAMYREFFEPKLTETSLTRTITQGFEDIETRVLWRERDLDAVVTFLKKLNR